MDATKFTDRVHKLFNGLKNLPIVRKIPHIQATLAHYEAKVCQAAATIAASVPDGAPASVVVDAIFKYLESVSPLPWEKQVLEWLRIAADALLASPPAV